MIILTLIQNNRILGKKITHNHIDFLLRIYDHKIQTKTPDCLTILLLYPNMFAFLISKELFHSFSFLIKSATTSPTFYSFQTSYILEFIEKTETIVQELP